jgi:glutamine synthetase
MSFAQRCGVHGAARQAASQAVLRRVQEAGVQQVRVSWADLHGTLRGKTLVCGDSLRAVTDALDGGIGMVGTVLLKDTSDRTAFKIFEPGAMAGPGGADRGHGAGGAGPAVGLERFAAAANVQLLPDPASFTLLPWAPGTAWLRAEPFWGDGSPVAVDPRRVLQRALAALAGQGLALQCGLEIEFHIYRIADERLAPEDSAWPAEPPALRLIHPGYHLLAEAHADMADEALALVRRTALGLGLPLRSMEIELGPSQVEAVFAPTDALTAADQMVMFRNGVRQALRRAGYHASFVCRPPLPQAIASGWHLHQSLQRPDGSNAMAVATAAGGDTGSVLSDTGANWLAGLLAHASGMAALCAPTLPAYSRYQGSVMAPQCAVWGRDNRGAMLRVVGGAADAGGGAATRIENRLGEPLANPYLAIAAQVFAGLDGLQRRLQPGPATEDPYAPGQPLLPITLAAALHALDADAVLQQGLGADMARVFATTKRQEIARHAQAVDPALWERREYFSRY